MNVLTPLKSVLMDHVRLVLMTRIQHRQQQQEAPQAEGAFAVSFFHSELFPLLLALAAVAVLSMVLEAWDASATVGPLTVASVSDSLRACVFRRNQITIEGRHVTVVDTFSTRVQISTTFSQRFRAVMHHLVCNLSELRDVYEIKEIINVLSHENGNKTMFTVAQRGRIVLDKERSIYCTVTELLDQDSSEKNGAKSNTRPEIRMYRFAITVFSYHCNVAELQAFVESLQVKYTSHLESLRKHKLFVYTLKNVQACDEDDTESANAWYETPHETMKSFDNLFFEEKPAVLKKIDFFVNNKEWYRANGVPYTLGIALFGAPGTGKTSFIKALASRLGRHIVSISLASIVTRKQLHDVFHTTRYTENEKEVLGFDRKIIVFEDIDCVGDVVLKRKEVRKDGTVEREDEEEEEDAPSVALAGATNSGGDLKQLAQMLVSSSSGKGAGCRRDASMSSTANEKIALDDLLNLLDGICEHTGRIMILSTNHFHKLDPALVRPGRVDIALHLDNCSRSTLAEMYQHYYKEPLPATVWDELPDRTWSPAEVMNAYVSHHDNPSAFLAKITRRKPDSP
jgi:DNA replication protein DnaC